MKVFTALKHKILDDTWGCPTQFGEGWEIGQSSKPELLGETTTMEAFKEYWRKVEDSEELIQQLQDYNLVRVFVGEIGEIEEAQSWKEENFRNVDMAGETIRLMERELEIKSIEKAEKILQHMANQITVQLQQQALNIASEVWDERTLMASLQTINMQQELLKLNKEKWQQSAE